MPHVNAVPRRSEKGGIFSSMLLTEKLILFTLEGRKDTKNKIKSKALG
jgi:hypothetical protein